MGVGIDLRIGSVATGGASVSDQAGSQSGGFVQFERMVIEAECQGQTFDITKDGKRVAVMIGYGEWEALTEQLGRPS